MEVDKRSLRRNRLKLLFIAAVFFLPLLLAWALVMLGWSPAGAVNYGQLVQPPVASERLALRQHGEPLAPQRLRGQWTLLIASADGCRTPCLEVLEQTARVHVALNQNRDRVRRVLVTGADDQLPAQLERFERYSAAAGLLRQWLGEDPVTVQLIDPAGLHVMSYPFPLDARGLLKDFERLLRLSKRDVERYRAMVEEGVNG